ncbi:hypothetical protein IP92_02825 [Pseudoduganella flava]|uniref:Cell envelope biogenesis protein TolA n=2 Tax=Pseudoduganella flava TaxID=871742 RepID=A0A562PTS7_9BURK|nr:hypothetical protein IP92_02825 [Pseudoduganella flava]
MALHLKATMAVGALICGLAGAAAAQELPARVPNPAITTVEQADAKLADVKRERDAAEADYAAAEQVCYAKFFVNNCLDKAKETRRARLAELRKLEIDANYFKRKNSVEVRDRELEERAQRDAAEQASRAAKPPAQRVNPDDKPRPVPLVKTPAERQAEYAERQKQRQAADAKKASERAQNVADYQRKQAESAERQQRVADKKAEREARRLKREADEAAKKAAAAARAKEKAEGKPRTVD